MLSMYITWTPERQSHCSYNSHVSIFYSASNRGAWSLGSKFILKERSSAPPNFERANLQFLSSKTTIPIPQTVQEWTEDDGTYFQIMNRMKGQPLSEAWPTMSQTDKERVASQTAEYLKQLQELHSDRMESLGGQPLYDAFLFPPKYGVGHGPFSSDDELWAEMSKSLTHVQEEVRVKLRERLPTAAPYTFTHGDLTDVNIMVEDGHLVGIIDWEAARYFPAWWEFAALSIGLGQVDVEWKQTLRRYMPSADREF
ncbi:unnamed protein product [Penicillium salamii]|nr:unnamed protein product [Penicillium salamii]CAG8255639.1 unnamed protein product [Penicillium salamii]